MIVHRPTANARRQLQHVSVDIICPTGIVWHALLLAVGVVVLVVPRHQCVAVLQNHVVPIFQDILVHIMSVHKTRGHIVIKLVTEVVLVTLPVLVRQMLHVHIIPVILPVAQNIMVVRAVLYQLHVR